MSELAWPLVLGRTRALSISVRCGMFMLRCRPTLLIIRRLLVLAVVLAAPFESPLPSRAQSSTTTDHTALESVVQQARQDATSQVAQTALEHANDLAIPPS